jgi:hypothetical protein
VGPRAGLDTEARGKKQTQHFSIMKTSRSVMFKEIIAVYSGNLAKPVTTLWVKCIVTVY